MILRIACLAGIGYYDSGYKLRNEHFHRREGSGCGACGRSLTIDMKLTLDGVVIPANKVWSVHR